MWWILLLSCSGEEPIDSPYATPDLKGPFEAVAYETSLESRSGLSLPLEVWYPTTTPKGEDLYLYGDFFSGEAFVDGPAACETPRPVVVFSHGNQGLRYQSFFLSEWLVQHGYIVLAPDHVYNTLVDWMEERLGEVGLRRPLDIADSFDWLLEQSADSGSPLSGCVDPEAGYAVMGHSFGGYTALAVGGAMLDLNALSEFCGDDRGWVCEFHHYYWDEHPETSTLDLSDSRTWATIPLAPGGVEAFGDRLSDIEVPALVMGATNDTACTMDGQVRPAFEGIDSTPSYLAELLGGDHFSFTLLCDLFPIESYCDGDSLPTEDAFPALQVSINAFLDVARGEERSADWLPLEDDLLLWEAAD